jgi:hypothetical protein
MNPLQRRLFRLQQPGMSRQPMGILASSPQMMEAAQRNMNQGPLPGFQTGGSVNVLQNPAIYGNTSTQDLETATSTMFGAQNPMGGSPSGLNPPLSSVTNPINATNASILDRTIASADERIKPFAEDSRSMMQQNRKTVEGMMKNMPSRETEIAALGSSVNKAYDDLFQAVGEDVKSFDDYKLSDYEDKALEVLGYDPTSDDPQKQGIAEAADDDKKASIWLNLMKAGLAMASGESANTLTNVAKGLSFGLEGYGEDIKAISAEEKAQNRELASIKMSLLKDDRDLDLMRRTNKIQAAQMRASLGEGILAEQRAQINADIDRQLQFSNIESGLFKSINEMGIDLAKADQDAELKRSAIDATLRNAVPEEIRMLEANGSLLPTDPNVPVDPTNPDSYTLSPKGQGLIDAWFKNQGSTKLTSLQSIANEAEQSLNVQGVDFSHLGEQGAAMARGMALQVGTDPASNSEDRAASIIPLARAYGGQIIDTYLKNYIIENNDYTRAILFDAQGNPVNPNDFQGKRAEDELKAAVSTIRFTGTVKPPASDEDDELATPVGG